MELAVPMDDSHLLHVVMFPCLGFGHIFPFVQLSNRLHENGVKVTFLSPPSLNPRIRSSLSPHITIVNYHVPSVEGLPAGIESTFESPAGMVLLMQAMDSSRPQIEDLLSEISPDVIIFDFVYHWIPRVARSLGVKSVYFSVFTAFTAASAAAPPLTVSITEKAPAKLLAIIADLKLYEARRSIEFLRADRRSKFSIYGRMVASMTECSAIALKSANEIESRNIQFFSALWRKPVLLTGALMPKSPAAVEIGTDQWDKWLAKFPPRSVVFCSFGSETCLSTVELHELVAGLELSGSPFLAVLNIPTEGTCVNSAAESELLGERSEGRGMVRRGWVQQNLILRHPSVGAYLCHAGYGFVMEAAAGGCQLVLLPQKADQFYNAKLMVGRLKAAVEVERRYHDGWFGREDVCNAVKKVMVQNSTEAMKVRANNAKLQEFLNDDNAQKQYTNAFMAKLNGLVKTPNLKRTQGCFQTPLPLIRFGASHGIVFDFTDNLHLLVLLLHVDLIFLRSLLSGRRCMWATFGIVAVIMYLLYCG